MISVEPDPYQGYPTQSLFVTMKTILEADPTGGFRRQHLLLQCRRLSRSALIRIGDREVVHRRECVRMLLSHDPPAVLQHLLLKY